MHSNLNSVILRVAEGDPVAFREVFETFSPKVYGFALKLTHSPATAEEIVQEVFMKVWMHRATLEGIDNFPAYVYTITRNLSFNVLKRLSSEQKAKAAYLRNLREETFETEDTIIKNDYQHILQNAINGLSPQQRMVYILCHGEGLKYDEAAQKLRISRFTVKTHMQQAIRNIRSHFKRVVTILAISVSCFF